MLSPPQLSARGVYLQGMNVKTPCSHPKCSILYLWLNFPGALTVLTRFPFSCRTYNDSCFLDSPLYPELADVQWYGQEKAKPGTLV